MDKTFQKLFYGTIHLFVSDANLFILEISQKKEFLEWGILSPIWTYCQKQFGKLREINISPLDAFRFVSLIDALPVEWREALKTSAFTGEEPFDMHDEIKLSFNRQNVLIKTMVSK